MRYATIVADPPWPYRQAGGPRSATTHRLNAATHEASGAPAQYGAMTIADICDLSLPAADNAHLYLWTTNAFMDEAHDVVRAWGFEPKTICTWGKVQVDGITPSYRMGYYFRGATEHWIFAVRGRQKLLRKDLPTLYLWRRLPHSVKPDEFYDLAQSASPGPYLEMFARKERPGWHSWGNEVESDVEIAV